MLRSTAGTAALYTPIKAQERVVRSANGLGIKWAAVQKGERHGMTPNTSPFGHPIRASERHLVVCIGFCSQISCYPLSSPMLVKPAHLHVHRDSFGQPGARRGSCTSCTLCRFSRWSAPAALKVSRHGVYIWTYKRPGHQDPRTLPGHDVPSARGRSSVKLETVCEPGSRRMRWDLVFFWVLYTRLYAGAVLVSSGQS